MPWESKKQARWGHGKGGKKAGFSKKKIEEWDDKTNWESLPEEAAEDSGSDPERGKLYREQVRKQQMGPSNPSKRGGFHSPKKKGYTRHPKHKGKTESESLTPIDETYRQYRFPLAVVAGLDWSTHAEETHKDSEEKHPAWGYKSIIDRGVKPHEKQDGDKRIRQAEDMTQKRDIPGKKFRAYSLFNWD
jgi:hypothetical protein